MQSGVDSFSALISFDKDPTSCDKAIADIELMQTRKIQVKERKGLTWYWWDVMSVQCSDYQSEKNEARENGRMQIAQEQTSIVMETNILNN